MSVGVVQEQRLVTVEAAVRLCQLARRHCLMVSQLSSSPPPLSILRQLYRPTP